MTMYVVGKGYAEGALRGVEEIMLARVCVGLLSSSLSLLLLLGKEETEEGVLVLKTFGNFLVSCTHGHTAREKHDR